MNENNVRCQGVPKRSKPVWYPNMGNKIPYFSKYSTIYLTNNVSYLYAFIFLQLTLAFCDGGGGKPIFGDQLKTKLVNYLIG